MNRDEFCTLLDRKGYVYEVTETGVEVKSFHNVYLSSLTTLPEGTTFSNGGYVDLSSLTTLPEGTTFSNGGYVDLSSLTTLPEGTTFSNGGYVDLGSLTTLPEGTTFSNGGYVDLGSLTTLPEGTTFSNGGNVDLSSLTTLPEGTTFSNGGNVYLGSLTTLPEGTTFSNGGNVYLGSLTTLPEGTTFSNGGNVDLSSLTTLPEGTTFSNGGNVDLGSLTTLPEGTTFSNGGNVDLGSLTDEYQTYRGQRIRLKRVDGFTMLVRSERMVGEVALYSAAYFGGGELADLKACYVAHQGEHFAHGSTVEQAMRDLRFKVMEHDFDEGELVDEIKARGTVMIEEFRLITGACEEGTRHGMAEAGLDPEANELPLATVLSAAFGHYGERFKALFQKEAA
ncbi:hypothetical protein [Novosphingobium sp. KA1]|uniref:hypothetical protein n=1 Tax=Novosphingobium sp. (strain KA1) TaxID=164608 RepID=UPI001A8FF042|nr:hypothetical protein [Novosphingobium sp. KA1]QSR18447.1 hypothetical protein CA833_14835 [Novosphingobium sp. KA1]